jgi:hypothetical protein
MTTLAFACGAALAVVIVCVFAAIILYNPRNDR